MVKIICAAIYYNDGHKHMEQPKNITTGFVICGRRHNNCCYIFLKMMGDLPPRIEKGFLTTDDRYVSRAEAYDIARDAGQLLNPKVHDPNGGNILISEDLWRD